MADIKSVISSVDAACVRYQQDLQQIEEIEGLMQSIQNSLNRLQIEMQQTEIEINSVESEISSLQSQINSSNDEDGPDQYAMQRVQLLYQKLQALNMKKVQLDQQYQQYVSQYRQLQAKLTNLQNDVETVRTYLQQVRAQMFSAAEMFQTKIDGFSNAASILSGASGNMFANSALSQVGNMSANQKAYEENLAIAQAVIEKIDSTINDSGTSPVKVLRR